MKKYNHLHGLLEIIVIKNKKELFEFLQHLEERKKKGVKILLAFSISVFVAIVLIIFAFTAVNIKNYYTSVILNLLLCVFTSILPISLFYYLSHSSKAEKTTDRQYATAYCFTLTFYVVLVTIAVPLITYTGEYSLRTWWMCVTANFYNGSITDDINKIRNNHYLNLSGSYIYPPTPVLNPKIGQSIFKCEHGDHSYKFYCAIALVGANFVNTTNVTVYATCETDCDQKMSSTCQDFYENGYDNDDNCFNYWRQFQQGSYAFIFVNDLDDDEAYRMLAAQNIQLQSSEGAIYGRIADNEYIEFVEKESIDQSIGISFAVFSIIFGIFFILICIYYYFNIWKKVGYVSA